MTFVGQTIDRYELTELIGRGSYADVYRAIDKRLDRAVAIKVFRAPFSDEQTSKRFEQEANAAARLNHPHVIRLLESNVLLETQYIVYDLIDGVTLRQWVEFCFPHVSGARQLDVEGG